jgi:5-methylcytosine-specific restriction endonuclease McrA
LTTSLNVNKKGDKMGKKGHIGIYGSIKIQRVYCNECKGMTMVIDNKKQCCGKSPDYDMNGYHIIAAPNGKRSYPRKRIRDKILLLQNDKCLYCGKPFGTMYERNGKVLFTKLCWDHKVPFSYTQNNETENWAAACHICNGIKYNKMFNTVEEVIEYVADRRKKKGYVYYEDETEKMS